MWVLVLVLLVTVPVPMTLEITAEYASESVCLERIEEIREISEQSTDAIIASATCIEKE